MKKSVAVLSSAVFGVVGLLLMPGISFAQPAPTVPEPISLFFLGAGLVGLGVIGRIIKK